TQVASHPLERRWAVEIEDCPQSGMSVDNRLECRLQSCQRKRCIAQMQAILNVINASASLVGGVPLEDEALHSGYRISIRQIGRQKAENIRVWRLNRRNTIWKQTLPELGLQRPAQPADRRVSQDIGRGDANPVTPGLVDQLNYA